jgi:hypothetical protein
MRRAGLADGHFVGYPGDARDSIVAWHQADLALCSANAQHEAA